MYLNHLWMLSEYHIKYHLAGLGKRYLPPADLSRSLDTIPGLDVHACGTSVEGRPIVVAELGSGPIRVLMWSQMHGNEATTTRAVADLLHLLAGKDPISQDLRRALTIRVLPQLNPDGAQAYTRENAAGVDLNRSRMRAVLMAVLALFVWLIWPLMGMAVTLPSP